jgi:hypothetical protein
MVRDTTRTGPDSIVVDVEGLTHRDAASLIALLRLSAYVSEAQGSHIELAGAMSGFWQT